MSIPRQSSSVDQATRDILTELSMGDSGALGEAASLREQLRAESHLDPKSFALVKIASLVSMDAPPASYLFQVQLALDSGCTPREILGVLTAIAPQTGIPKIVAAAPEIMIALGLELPADASV